jgi:hypothetical protein
MQRLISAMGNWGFSWPTCPEAGTGKPGYEAYDECPSGWSVGSSNQDHGGGQGDLCIQVRNRCPSGYGGRDGCQETVTMPRPVAGRSILFRHHGRRWKGDTPLVQSAQIDKSVLLIATTSEIAGSARCVTTANH